jgi:hypothetical protein
MISKPVVFGMLAAGCIAAAGAGAYLSSREPSAAAAQLGRPGPPVDPVDPVDNVHAVEKPAGVEATEAVIQDAPEPPKAEREDLRAEASPPETLQRERAVRERPETRRRAPMPPPPAPQARASASPPAAPNTGTYEGGSGPERSWPTRDSGNAAESGRGGTATASATDITAVEPTPPPPPARRLEELVISADSVIGLQVETAVSSEHARVEDKVEARVIRDVKAGSDVAIPAGSRALGSITVVDKGGKLRERARLGIRFHTIVLEDGTEVPLRTETVYREGTSPSRESAAKVGGAAVGGAILGAILGGKKGAVLGGAAGAAGGTAAVMAGDRNPATLPAGTTLTVRLSDPTTVTIERERQ